jgi:hypothetical protein
MTETNSLFFRIRSLFRYAYGMHGPGDQTARRFLPLALRRLITALPVGELMRFLKPCARFCLRLLFCAVVSDIVLLLLNFFEVGRYYKLKSKYVKQKTVASRVVRASVARQDNGEKTGSSTGVGTLSAMSIPRC